jgi:hypothetical protein
MKKLSILLLLFAACKGQNKITFTPDFETPAPPALVYKTKGNYANLVPVLLSDDKTEIISYPHPGDVKTGDGFLTPTLLNNNYFLDNKGIGSNVAFLKLTYNEYAALENAPTLKEMYELIIDKDPLIELCNCGNKKALSNPAKQLNKVIDKKQLRTVCKVVK